MDLNKRIEKAIEYKHHGYNCCQAVLLACADLLKTDTETLKNISSGFGSGMGCMEATCGALCGAIMTAGLLKNGNKTVLTSKEILKNFEKKSNATTCKILKGTETGTPLCSCDDCIKNSIEALMETLLSQDFVLETTTSFDE